MSAFEQTHDAVRVPLGTKVIFTQHREEPHPRFDDVTRVVTDDLVAVTIVDVTKEGRRERMFSTTFRSAGLVALNAQEWVHPEDGEVV